MVTNEPDRDIKYETHIATHCFFSKEELERLVAIKSRKDWKPRFKRQAARKIEGFNPLNKRTDLFWKYLMLEFNQICAMENRRDS